ncbi:unnamed protein product [Lampetra planeri]
MALAVLAAIAAGVGSSQLPVLRLGADCEGRVSLVQVRVRVGLGSPGKRLTRFVTTIQHDMGMRTSSSGVEQGCARVCTCVYEHHPPPSVSDGDRHEVGAGWGDSWRDDEGGGHDWGGVLDSSNTVNSTFPLRSSSSSRSLPPSPSRAGEAPRAASAGDRNLTSSSHLVISQCPEGYTWDSEIEQCRDIDECLTIADACKGGLRCVNNFGGYLCLPHSATLIFTVGTEEGGAAQDAHRGTQPPAAPPRTQGTSTGPPSVLRPPAALPALERLAFSAGELVEPPPGPPAPRAQGPYADPPVRAPHVVCSPGYEGDSAGRCVDVDECARGSHRCRPGQRCVNEAGSHSCRCPDGFTLLGAQCVDVDECRLGLCSHQCLNSPGSFRCACSIGFSLAADNRTCTDLDECEVERPCSQNCLNLYGSFLCRCDSGFELDGDQRSCRDVDECAFSQYLCQFRCENHAGSYACSCPHGYRLQSDTRSCRDVDECEEGSHGCPEGASCFNVQGSHRCLPRITCSAPYTLIGDNRCVCPGEIPACREEPYIVLHKAMQMQAGRTAPSDVFQMQATAQYPGAFYTFRIAAGDDAGHFLMRQIGSASAMLVLTRPVTGPRDLVLDLEMLTINPAAGTRGSSIIRLSIFVTEHPF